MAKDFKIAKTQGLCTRCEQALNEESPIVCLARLGEDGIVREDYHPPCWDAIVAEAPADQPAPGEAEDVLGLWHSIVPKKEEKKKLLIDDALLINFFQRLDDTDEPTRIAFRYVLALILMRKKILVYLGSHRDDEGTEIWQMRLRKFDTTHDVIDPGLDEDRIAEVSEQLGEIMEGDFDE
ncbi:MAG: hypothetical protein HN909_05090 [Phycisphaerales bacterium]|jgi:hypothetical protein|nr:hypothetical protein [Phycisphaerales bacterium]MBT7171127.1 hypothetical protein [Phycisphaerales bacterium]